MNHYHKRIPRLVYRDDLTPEEAGRLLAEVGVFDTCYADAELLGVVAATEDEKEIAAALIEGGLDYFNRYIAGDR